MNDGHPWGLARDALRLIALDPVGMAGLWLRARPGPARDGVTAALEALSPRRIHPGLSDEALDGGLDLAATLAAGAPRYRDSILAGGGLVCLAMAERCSAALAARLCQAMDAGHCGLVALDEAAEEGEGMPLALRDRLGLFVALDGIALADLAPLAPIAVDPATRTRYADLALTEDDHRTLVETCAALGIDSLRAPLLAGRAARGLAALAGRDAISARDLQRAAMLALAHRGSPAADEADTTPDPTPEPDTTDQDDAPETAASLPSELLVEAALATLPQDLLARLADDRQARSASSAHGSGAAIRGNRRGRPLASRPGRLDGSARLDVTATLRAAAPWQTLRAAQGGKRLVHLRPSDFRIRRFDQKSDRLLIFTLDASGSQAMARLAEVKGAIELLLSQSYARRDHVALIGFRGTVAELLLPPTRSLVQTKRRLAALPGGGGTPLAAGLTAALDLARQVAGQGFTPSIVVLTDGRANIDLGGQADRMRAGQDAARVARVIGATRPGGLVIDTGRRANAQLQELAGRMAAHYLPLPRVDASQLGTAVRPILAS
ncbi:magnesium chelatase subunit D [Maribius pontilimi]|uniref:Magnesium chelatase subunit D n=1 Tax=Palleronia pontilimi TaxID=1964209 RepID=A0A934IDG0_9RHOB|nr:magnesium chelatase subunit D [Palleronia pontilimi]MBJ3761470.1 magnesium chelatase subunit D [Palleronia pontilimi]